MNPAFLRTKQVEIILKTNPIKTIFLNRKTHIYFYLISKSLNMKLKFFTPKNIKKILFLHFKLFVGLLVTSLSVNGQMVANQPTDFENNSSLENQRFKSPFGFTENKGQMTDTEYNLVPNVFFKVETPGLNIWVTKTGLTYQFYQIKQGEEQIDDFNETGDSLFWTRVDLILKESNILKENIYASAPVSNEKWTYYTGHFDEGIEDVTTYSKLLIKDIYEGIDWELKTLPDGNIKYDFIVHPHANPDQIKLIYEGNGEMQLTNTNLQFSNALGKVVEGELMCFQGDEPVKSRYKSIQNSTPTFLGEGNFDNHPYSTNSGLFSYEITIDLEKYDRNKVLIIDPELTWGTLFGGELSNSLHDMVTDNDGNLFVSGRTHGTDFPVLDAGTYFNGVLTPVGDIFIAKFDNNGTLLWGTFYSGEGIDEAYAIATDNDGNIWLTGSTSSESFPLQDAGTFFQNDLDGLTDAFVLKFSNEGERLLCTYYGGNEVDTGHDIEVDVFGNVWILGRTNSTIFPLQDIGTFFQGFFAGMRDLFILKFDNAGNRELATFYGGTNVEVAADLITDLSGNVFFYCQTFSTDIPLQNAGTYFDNTYGGLKDVHISKLDNDGNLLWATYYGSDGTENIGAIGTDSFGNLFVVGSSNSETLPLQDAGTYFQGTLEGPSDIFILKFDNLGNRLWATFYGGDGGDLRVMKDLAVDDCDNIFVYFTTWSTDIPMPSVEDCHYFDDTYEDMRDVFIAKFGNDGTLTWGSYMGGSDMDNVSRLVVDPSGDFFFSFAIQNYEDLEELPLLDAGGTSYFDDEIDVSLWSILLMKFEDTLRSSLNTVDATPCFCDGEVTVKIDCGLPPYNFVLSSGAETLDTMVDSVTISDLCPDDYWVEVTSRCLKVDTLYFSIEGEGWDINIGNDTLICEGNELLLDAGNPGAEFLWQDGSTEQTFNVESEGIYWVQVSLDSCTTVDTISVSIESINTVFSVQDTVGCAPLVTDFYDFSETSSSPIANWLWNFGDGESSNLENSTHSYVSSGSYEVSLTVTSASGCSNDSSRSVDILIYETPIAAFNFSPGYPSHDEEVHFMNESIGEDSWYWSFGDGGSAFTENPIHKFEEGASAEVFLKVTNTHCEDSIVKTIYFDNEVVFYVPNAFTPDGDNFNAVFMPIFSPTALPSDYQLLIFDRWGETLFQSQNYTVGWDGTGLNGNLVQDGIYVWRIELSVITDLGIEKKVYNGYITLLK